MPPLLCLVPPCCPPCRASWLALVLKPCPVGSAPGCLLHGSLCPPHCVCFQSPPALVPGPWTSPAVHSPVTPDQLFHRLDRNHDGVITHAEWNQAFGSQSIHPSETTSPEILQHLAGRIQSNENSDGKTFVFSRDVSWRVCLRNVALMLSTKFSPHLTSACSDLALQLNHLKQELSSNLQVACSLIPVPVAFHIQTLVHLHPAALCDLLIHHAAVLLLAFLPTELPHAALSCTIPHGLPPCCLITPHAASSC